MDESASRSVLGRLNDPELIDYEPEADTIGPSPYILEDDGLNSGLDFTYKLITPE